MTRKEALKSILEEGRYEALSLGLKGLRKETYRRRKAARLTAQSHLAGPENKQARRARRK